MKLRLWIIDKLFWLICELMPKSDSAEDDLDIYQRMHEAYVQMKYNHQYKQNTIHVSDLL